jgi:hypothetical protein
MSNGYATPMAPSGGNSMPGSGGAGGGNGSVRMPRDIQPRSSSSFKKGAMGPPNFEHYGGKRMVERRSRR